MLIFIGCDSVTSKLLFYISIRACGEATKGFIKFFCDRMKTFLPNLGRNVYQFCIAHFLHPYYKGYVLQLKGENDTLRQSTIGKIKEMVNNLDLEVSCKIWKLIFDECELLLYLCNSRFRVRWNWEPFCITTTLGRNYCTHH